METRTQSYIHSNELPGRVTRSRLILIASTTRADWGILSPLARALADRDDCEVKVLASNMHLDPQRGRTIDEIRADGFDPIVALMPFNLVSSEDAAAAAGDLQKSVAKALSSLDPDVLVLLGDRFEVLSIASAANIMRIPIVHISGGEITQGAFDDSYRHALTKLSTLHLTATERYRQRVIQLGEQPEMVINCGALGVQNVLSDAILSRSKLEKDLCWDFGENAMLVTVHPETVSQQDIITPTLQALNRFPQSKLLITYPNNDPAGRYIIDAIETYAKSQPEGRIKLVPSLGRLRYHSALRCVKMVVGNSSSGVVEVPSVGIPTVNIGNRQYGRIAASSVISCDAERDAITDAIKNAFEFDCTGVENPYYKADTLQLMVDAIAKTPLEKLREPKRFYDL